MGINVVFQQQTTNVNVERFFAIIMYTMYHVKQCIIILTKLEVRKCVIEETVAYTIVKIRLFVRHMFHRFFE